jgi:ABC-type uncharacterized transport system permease subunit
MSQQVDAATVTSQEAEAPTEMSEEVSERGTGGAIFAGTLLIIASSLWILEGLAGIVRGTSYIESANYWITTSASTWGWIHLVGGLIGLAAGFGIFSGAGWARWLGILIASVSVIVNFAFIPLAPFWALTLIFIDLWVIHSLFVHRRLRD